MRGQDRNAHGKLAELRRLVTDTADVDLTQGGPVPEEVHALLEYGVMASRRGSSIPLTPPWLPAATGRCRAPNTRIPSGCSRRNIPDTGVAGDVAGLDPAGWLPRGGGQGRRGRRSPTLCHLDAARTDRLLQQVHALARRVCACLPWRGAALQPASQRRRNVDYDFELLRLSA